jgi:hypothetical protein
VNEAPFFANQGSNPESTAPSPKELDSSAIEIHLSSVGKLSFPPRIYIRDYSIDNSILLATSGDTNFLRHLVCVLNDIISGEGSRAEDLHENEMEEILLTVFASFWQKTMEFPYFPTDEEFEKLDDGTKALLKSGELKPKYEIDLTTIGTTCLPEDFAEPIVITYKGKSFRFRLPRVGDYLMAEDFVLAKMAFKEKDFQDVENMISFNEEMKKEGDPTRMKPIDPARYRAYREFLEEKGRLFMKVQQSLCLLGIDGTEFSTLEQKMAADVPLHLWSKVKTYFDKKLTFGVNHKVKILSPLTKMEREMDVPFRYLDFIPSSNISDTSDLEIRFGV